MNFGFAVHLGSGSCATSRYGDENLALAGAAGVAVIACQIALTRRNPADAGC